MRNLICSMRPVPQENSGVTCFLLAHVLSNRLCDWFESVMNHADQGPNLELHILVVYSYFPNWYAESHHLSSMGW